MGAENSPLQGSDPCSVQPVARRCGQVISKVSGGLRYYRMGGLRSFRSDLLNLASCAAKFGKTWSACEQHEENRHNSMLK